MTERSNALGYGCMTISFYVKSGVAAGNYVTTHSCLNYLIFYTLDYLHPGYLDNYELFRTNLNFHIASDGCTESYYLITYFM